MHRFPNEVAKSFHLIHKDFDNMYIYKVSACYKRFKYSNKYAILTYT